MRVDYASPAAIAYACRHFHYAQRHTFSFVGYNVYNDQEEWCGVICFNRPNREAERPFGLVPGEVAELVRVALNGKQATTSQALMLAVRQFAKDAPLVQLLVSYADAQEGHIGTIYQATNWTYLQQIKGHPRWRDPASGAYLHGRMVSPSGTVKLGQKTANCRRQADLIKVPVAGKHKYAYPLCKSAAKILRSLATPYPKNALSST